MSICLSKQIRTWPAIIFAVSRINRVIGRIIILTVSMITIKGTKNIGVFMGTRWVIKLLLLSRNIFIEKDNHKGVDKKMVRIMWLVGAKIKGKSLIKFNVQIITKMIINKIEVFKCFFFKFVFKSFLIKL